jgi:hypothetical protein
MTTCTESIPDGATRPVLVDAFPATGTSGYAATLRVDVEHGPGEAVLPQGLALAPAAGSWAEIRAAGFALPDQDAGAPAVLGPSVIDKARPERAHTVLELPLVLLPSKPGRSTLELPPLPIAVSRASGEVMTVCTTKHVITVEDPIANVAEAVPQPNPSPLPQREDWQALRVAAIALAVAAVLAIVVAILAARWARRPKRVAPAPPPKPPWEIALARLDDLRRSGALERGELREYVDTVSDVLRQFLGASYGFDGIESTTDEIRHTLGRVALRGTSLPVVLELLEASDLVKFAGVVPPPSECLRMMSAVEAIVRSGIPVTTAPRGPMDAGNAGVAA